MFPIGIVSVADSTYHFTGEKDFVVKRSNVLKSMLNLYSSHEVCYTKLVVGFEDEKAADAGGVTRELFSCFWTEAYQHYFNGEILKVPFIPPSRLCEDQSVFMALGRIFSHGYLLTGRIPIRVCQASLMSLLFGPEKVPENVLLQSFLSYVTPWEKQMIEKGMEGLSPDQEEEMMGLFSRMGMRCTPAKRGDEFRKQVVHMAKSQLIYKPSMALTWMKQGIPDSQFEKIWQNFNPEKFSDLFQALVPTTEKVVKKIIQDKWGPLTNDEEHMLYVVKTSVREFNPDQLEKFLHFVTGSPTAPLNPIRVSFHAACGLTRAPSSSTCASVLYVSTSYDSLHEFKRELCQVIESDEAYIMSNV